MQSNQRETHMEENKKKSLTPNVFTLSFLEAAGSRRSEKNAALFVPVQVHNRTELSSGFDLVCKVIFYVVNYF